MSGGPEAGKPALSKAEQQVVIGNIKEKIPGGLVLALEATLEQPDAGVIEKLKFAGSMGPIELMITQKTCCTTSTRSKLRKLTPVELSRHGMPPARDVC